MGGECGAVGACRAQQPSGTHDLRRSAWRCCPKHGSGHKAGCFQSGMQPPASFGKSTLAAVVATAWIASCGVRLLSACEKCGLLGQIQRNNGGASLLMEGLSPGRSPGILREEGERTRTKSQVNLWKCFWMTNTKGQGPSWYYSIFWVDSQFELHPSGWWGVWDTQGHAWPC